MNFNQPRSPYSVKNDWIRILFYKFKNCSLNSHTGGTRWSMTIIVLMLSFACSSGSDFSGSSGKKEAKLKKAEKSSANKGDEDRSETGKNGDQKTKDSQTGKNEESASSKPQPPTETDGEQVKQVAPPEKCDPASGATFANLLSPLVQLGTPTSEIVYEIAITDCAGKVKNINAESISFDFDGEMGGVGLGAVLEYRLIAEGVTHSGVLEARDGQDLFGNKGPDFFHFITSQKVSTSTKSSSVRLGISLVNKAVKPRGSAPGVTSTEFKIKTFLKFGSATPVAKEVTFKSPGVN